MRGLQAALALAAQDGELVVAALLGGLLQLGEHEPQRADAVLLARLHRGGEVLLHRVGQRHLPFSDSAPARTASARRRRGVRPPSSAGRGGLAEPAELGGVAAEQQPDVPVDEQPRAAPDARHHRQVVGARQQPGRRAAPA